MLSLNSNKITKTTVNDCLGEPGPHLYGKDTSNTDYYS